MRSGATHLPLALLTTFHVRGYWTYVRVKNCSPSVGNGLVVKFEQSMRFQSSPDYLVAGCSHNLTFARGELRSPVEQFHTLLTGIR